MVTVGECRLPITIQYETEVGGCSKTGTYHLSSSSEHACGRLFTSTRWEGSTRSRLWCSTSCDTVEWL